MYIQKRINMTLIFSKHLVLQPKFAQIIFFVNKPYSFTLQD